MKTVLTIAGSDCSGGAGIQADLKTATAYGVYGMSAVTALTVQNTLGVTAVEETRAEILTGQLSAVFSDIFPDAVKIGMVPSRQSAEIISEVVLRERPRHVVVDPVMFSTGGSRLMGEDAAQILEERLYPAAEMITPNILEAEALTGRKICGKKEMERAARDLGGRYGTAVLIKGGHLTGDPAGRRADDCLFNGSGIIWFPGEWIEKKNSHGTGCTLSTAIACGLALSWPLEHAVFHAKEFLTGALLNEPGLGHGNGPLNHCFALSKTAWGDRYDGET